MNNSIDPDTSPRPIGVFYLFQHGGIALSAVIMVLVRRCIIEDAPRQLTHLGSTFAKLALESALESASYSIAAIKLCHVCTRTYIVAELPAKARSTLAADLAILLIYRRKVGMFP
jgi:hypothetical protein